MRKQVVSIKQGIFMMVMYILGTSFLVASGIEAGRDVWLAYLIGLIFSIVLALVYGRLLNYFPDKDLYDTLESLLGKTASRILLVLMAVFLFQHYSYVLRHFAGFINLVGLPEAPYVLPLVCLGILTALAVYSGIEVMGKWTVYFLLPIVAFIIFAALLLSKHMDLNQLRPVLQDGFAPVLKGAWTLISLPFAEIVAFLFVLPPMGEKGASYKVFFWGLLAGSVLVFIVSMTDVLVLGVDTVARLYYPTHTSMAIIQLGQFIKRLEVAAASIFTVAVFFKAAILLMAIIKCAGRIFGLDEPRILVMPIVSLAINYAVNCYESSIQFYAAIFLFWPPYSTIFQVLIPILLFIILEYRMAKRRKLKDAVMSFS